MLNKRAPDSGLADSTWCRGGLQWHRVQTVDSHLRSGMLRHPVPHLTERVRTVEDLTGGPVQNQEPGHDQARMVTRDLTVSESAAEGL